MYEGNEIKIICSFQTKYIPDAAVLPVVATKIFSDIITMNKDLPLPTLLWEIFTTVRVEYKTLVQVAFIKSNGESISYRHDEEDKKFHK